MDKNWWKSMLVVTVACLVIFGVLKIFFKTLPYILIIALVIYVISKVSDFIRSKRKVHNIDNSTINSDTYSSDDENGEVIDVDYKDVK